MSRHARLRHRLEWSWLGSGAYFLRDVWWNKMWRFNAPGKRRDAIVRDKIMLGSAMVLAVAGGAVFGALTGGWVARRLDADQAVRRAVPAVRADHRLDRVRAPRVARHPLVDPQGLDAVPRPDGVHHHPAHARGS